MKSSFDILSALYQIINVPELTNLLSGKIYIGSVPDKDQKENISIKTLNNPNSYLQSGFINLNIHLKEVSSGRADLERFNEIVKTLFPIIKDASHLGYFFQIDDDKGVFRDQERDSMYLYNIRLNFQTLKKWQ